MNDPKRLFEGSGTELERLVLGAGRSERPSRLAKRQGALAVAVMVQAGWVRIAWAKGLATLAGASPGAVVGVGVLVGGLAVGGLAVGGLAVGGLVGPAASPSAAPVSRALPVAAVSLPRLVPIPAGSDSAASVPSAAAILDTTVSPGPKSGAVPAAPRRGKGASEETVKAETESLDRVRKALHSGGSGNSASAGRALVLLDDHSSRFPRGVLQQEALLLRVESLVQAGRRGAAEALANRYLATHPTSPYAARIRSLLDRS